MTELRAAPSATGRLRTRHGRVVAFDSFGDPHGHPAFYLHGFPSSRLEAGLHAAAAARTGTRLIGLDRPGYGGSDPGVDAIADVAADVIDVADSLGIGAFGVTGVSGGAPYALACAALVPERTTAVALIAPLGPPDAPRYGMRPANRLLLATARTRPHLFASLQPVVASIVRKGAERVVASFARTLPRREQELVADPALRAAFADVVREAFVQRGLGALGDGLRLTRPWRIDFARIISPVRIWHGLLDDIVPPGMAGFLQAALPGAPRLEISPLDGHFSVVHNRIEDALVWTGGYPGNATSRGVVRR